MPGTDQTDHPEILKHWIDIQEKRPVLRGSFVNQIKAAMTYNAPLDPPEAKLLILASKADRLCNYQCSELIHKTWGGTLKLHDKAGHDLPIDASKWIIENINNWFKEH